LEQPKVTGFRRIARSIRLSSAGFRYAIAHEVAIREELIALVVLGAGTILGAMQNHRSYVRSLPAADLPKLPVPWLTSFLAGAVAVAGILLAAYLAVA